MVTNQKQRLIRIMSLIEAVKSNLGQAEDEQMDKEISKLAMESDDAIRAALAISRIFGKPDDETRELFKGPILNNVCAKLPNTNHELYDDEGWYAIQIPVKGEKYTLYINYDWRSVEIAREGHVPVSTVYTILAASGRGCPAYYFHSSGFGKSIICRRGSTRPRMSALLQVPNGQKFCYTISKASFTG